MKKDFLHSKLVMTLTAMDKSYASCYHSVSLPIRIMSYAV
ncbi:hypothetical protein SAMN05216518_10814 [Bacteroidales bacterium KHT7]|nr:hypothetical protein SAMN05216518_10814 [Bacteroidales bacterium KHT7]